VSDAYDQGYDLFRREPDLLLATVWNRAVALHRDTDYQHEFVDGYRSARRHFDGFRKGG
jgi:hypothetical protein